jgi:prophage regulatory protein
MSLSTTQLLARERERKRSKQAERAKRRKLRPRRMRILRLPEVMQRVGLKHASIYAAIAAGTFPKPIPLGERAVGWLEHEVDQWLKARVVERDNGTAVRSQPLAGVNQRRKAEAQERREARRVRGEPRRMDPVEARKTRRARGGGERTPRRADLVGA